MHAIPEHLRGVIMIRRYTNPRLPLPLPLHCFLTTLHLQTSERMLSDIVLEQLCYGPCYLPADCDEDDLFNIDALPRKVKKVKVPILIMQRRGPELILNSRQSACR